MLSQNMVINKILSDHSITIITLNNLNEKYFFNYTAEFLFIQNHYKKYGSVPDKVTFINSFPDFDLVEVTEPDSYLLEQLYKDYNQSYMANNFNKVKKLLENGQVDEAKEIWMSGISNINIGTAISCTDIIHDTKDRYNAYVERIDNYSKFYISTGFKELDQVLGGWDRQEEYGLVVARTNTGKSFVAIKMAVAAAQQGLRVGYYSGEMSARKVGYRVDTLLGNISNGGLIHGNSYIETQYEQYLDSLKFFDGNLFVLTPNDISGPANVPALQSFVEKQKLDILFIDQISLLEDARNGKSPVEKTSNISRDIKNLQVMCQIPVIAVCQQNRTKNEDGTQDTTQIAQSDRLGQDCTIAIFLDREKDEKNLLKFTIVKSRDSVVGNAITYDVDFNYGKWTYIPTEEDGLANNMPQETEQEIINSYDPEYESFDIPTEDTPW